MIGPDLVNSILGVLIRFRRHAVAITAVVEQMFYYFKVEEKHQDYLRFFWYQGHDFNKPLLEYRMTTHVFGKSPTPAVATFGLRRAVEQADTDVKELVTRDFYVDDALTSTPDSQSAISLMKITRDALQGNGNIRLHKIASNDKAVLEAFPTEDLSGDLKDLDLQADSTPLQRSLGLYWNLSEDTFTFKSDMDNKPYTKHGLLSTINSVFDPIGFAAPVVLKGKLLFRDLAATSDWDEPLAEDKRHEWESWQNSFTRLNGCRVPRQYLKDGQDSSVEELHIYSDASKEAIAAVAYFCHGDKESRVSSSFILGKAKVAPAHGHTIPRLELCAAVLATELGQVVCEQLDVDPATIHYHTDSNAILGADKKPADIGTRCIEADKLTGSLWLAGPSGTVDKSETDNQEYDLISPAKDSEVRPNVTSLKTISSTKERLGPERFSKFSTWTSLNRALALLISYAGHHSSLDGNKRYESLEALEKAKTCIIRETQQEAYAKEIKKLNNSEAISKDSPIAPLSPYLDEEGILRVGGRLNKSGFQLLESNPVIIPGKHHVATLLVRHHHSQVYHQVRHFTAGAIRSAGYWITGSKRLVSSLLNKCVRCLRLRGKPVVHLMAYLPQDRLTPSPPFTYVGVDIFSPWYVSSRRTRGAHSKQKRWAAPFTCLVTRAVHIEVVEDMSSSSFINALRRFSAIRRNAKVFRSGRGTNFVGCTGPVGIPAINVEDTPVANHLLRNGTVWRFNPPHALIWVGFGRG
ncbi:uncharacterized protein LOC110466593 [Mizuhopecten yessoensis]|uniref:uncharacterized protein LOC110466593 n=1 Tax=Mizuhopecten yessoensis TaxID=6573 RepID=UPI000B4595A0|nr:uncharacterized protein LOC110466593 [Mizuhopecten yessoensis]